jgi:hypothetical protein
VATAAAVRGLCWLTAHGTSVPSWGWRNETAWLLRAAILWPFLAFAVSLGGIIYFSAAMTVGSITRARAKIDVVEQHKRCERK